MKRSSSRRQTSRSVALTWTHLGTLHQVSPWPDVAFSAEHELTWTAYDPDPSSASFASAAVMLDRTKWDHFLDFLPAAERQFVDSFKIGRLAALVAITRCPDLFEALVEVPALTAFVAAHVALRGTGAPRWDEINALYERGGIYAVLEWLGLPASKRTLTILKKIANPDLAHRHLEPLRAALWAPEAIWVLEHTETLTEQILGRCHALAA